MTVDLITKYRQFLGGANESQINLVRLVLEDLHSIAVNTGDPNFQDDGLDLAEAGVWDGEGYASYSFIAKSLMQSKNDRVRLLGEYISRAESRRMMIVGHHSLDQQMDWAISIGQVRNDIDHILRFGAEGSLCKAMR